MEKIIEVLKAPTDSEKLIEAAQVWATHAIATYQADLLHKALAVSEAVANFVSELELRNDRP